MTISHRQNILNALLHANTAFKLWGSCESGSGGYFDNLFEQGISQGQTFVAATGDYGNMSGLCSSTAASVMYPASSPYVMVIGGTTLVSSGNNGYNPYVAYGNNHPVTPYYNAIAGYDMATGWSSFDITRMLAFLSGTSYYTVTAIVSNNVGGANSPRCAALAEARTDRAL